jgi:hypothetical protein
MNELMSGRDKLLHDIPGLTQATANLRRLHSENDGSLHGQVLNAEADVWRLYLAGLLGLPAETSLDDLVAAFTSPKQKSA